MLRGQTPHEDRAGGFSWEKLCLQQKRRVRLGLGPGGTLGLVAMAVGGDGDLPGLCVAECIRDCQLGQRQ